MPSSQATPIILSDRQHTLLKQIVRRTSNCHRLVRRAQLLLSDCPRRGTPNFFSTEQVVQIVALACEKPQASERPISHWSATELADEAIKRGIVEKISPRSVGRFLKRKQLYSHIGPLLAQR